MKLSVSSYSFNQYIKAGKLTQLECVAKAKELGFEAIEFTDIIAPDLEGQKRIAAEIRAEADRLGMVINAYTIGANLYYDNEEDSEREVKRLMDQLDVAKILGVSVMRHDVCHKIGKTGNSRSFALMLPTIAKNARRVTEYGASLGIRTCSENHGFVAQDSYRVEQLFNAVDHDNYGLLVDIGNFLCVDEDPITAVSRVAPYAFHAHVKDFRYVKEGECCGSILTRGANRIVGTVTGEGVVPVKQCLAILKRAGYDGYVSVEYEGIEDCIAGITRAVANVRSFIALI